MSSQLSCKKWIITVPEKPTWSYLWFPFGWPCFCLERCVPLWQKKHPRMIFSPRSPRWRPWSIKKMQLLICLIRFWSMQNNGSTLSKSESLHTTFFVCRVVGFWSVKNRWERGGEERGERALRSIPHVLHIPFFRFGGGIGWDVPSTHLQQMKVAFSKTKKKT